MYVVHYIHAMDQKINPTTQAYRRYTWEFGASMLGYIVVIILSRMLLHSLTTPPDRWQFAVALLPLIPVIFVFVAIVRLLLATDELQRRVYVNSLAIAGGVTALLAVTYGLIESEQFPPLSAWWTYSVFMISWLIATFFVRRSYR